MRSININKTLNTVVLPLAVLLLGASVAAAQQQINLMAAPSSLTLPDGSTVPMWGYNCGAAVSGSTATCAALNTSAAAGTWSPVVITVPTGQGLTINLTNNLYFTPTTPAGAPANPIPTSIMIVGQVGGGLGNTAKYVPSPDHSNAQANTTWPIANTGATALPPSILRKCVTRLEPRSVAPSRKTSSLLLAVLKSPAGIIRWSVPSSPMP